LEIARQKPTATRVAGLYAWNQLGRKVKKGERGIRILAPIIGVKRKKDEEAEKDITKQNTRVLVGFRNAYVFDVSQTEGAELPTMREISGDVGENRDRLLKFIERQGIDLVFTENIAPALGMSYGGRIAILPGQSEAEEFSTLVHEVAHEMLHKAERRTNTTKVVRETEAESVAFVIGKAVGLQTGTASADYIHLYHGNASLLAESLEVIQQTSAVILAALQPFAIETMPDAELAKVA
jgi:antirestriction protein ArdC